MPLRRPTPPAIDVRHQSRPGGSGSSSVLGTEESPRGELLRLQRDAGLESLTGSTADPFFDMAPPGGGPWLYSADTCTPTSGTSKRPGRRDPLDPRRRLSQGRPRVQVRCPVRRRAKAIPQSAGGPKAVYYYRNEYATSTTAMTYTYRVLLPGHIARLSLRSRHRRRSRHSSTTPGDVTESLTLNLGLRYDSINADIPDYPLLDGNVERNGRDHPGLKDAVDWTHFSPRLGFAYSFRDVGCPAGLLRQVLRRQRDGQLVCPTSGRTELLLRVLELTATAPGRLITSLTGSTTRSTRNMKPPETDQFTLGYEHRVGSAWTLGIQGVYKETKNLIGWEILDDGVYEMVPWTNPFTGEVQELASIIEQPTTVKGNRPGAGSLAPPGQVYEQDFKGVVLTFNKRYSNGWTMYGSYTYSNSTGYLPKPWSEVQGDPFYAAFPPDPNNFLNAEQALQNERRNVVQVQSTMDLPWKLNGTVNFRYLDGKPYNRQMSVGGLGSQTPLNQGSVTIIAIPATERRHPAVADRLRSQSGEAVQFGSGGSLGPPGSAQRVQRGFLGLVGDLERAAG